MEKKQRVDYGNKYWAIDDLFNVISTWDLNTDRTAARFSVNNYFHTKEEAEAMAKKLRAVLEGEEVYTLDEITEMRANAFADGMEAERRKNLEMI